jgi:hypothetical protein
MALSKAIPSKPTARRMLTSHVLDCCCADYRHFVAAVQT